MSKAEGVDPYRFSDALPYVLARAGVRMGGCFGQELAAYGMTLDMYRVLASLHERDDQTLGELSASISNELSTMSRLVTRMKGLGLVGRRRQAKDGRTVRIRLTASGRQLVLALIPRAVFWEDVAVEGLAPEDIKALKLMLKSVFDKISERKADPKVLASVFADIFPVDAPKVRVTTRRRA